MKIQIFIVLFLTIQLVAQVSSENDEILDIGSQLELFTDYFIIDSLKDTQLRLHHPVDRGCVLKFDKPWEGPHSGYCTIINNDEKFQLYYRGLPIAKKDGSTDETTCYAESNDGIKWSKPNLKIYKIKGTFNNNVILANAAPVTHNFTPFLDTKKNITSNQKYKALGGLEKSGLIAYVSADGIHWKKLQETPLITGRKSDFDSQNVAFWSEAEQQYICYYRTWVKINEIRYRSIARTTSPDFIKWTKPVEMGFGNTPREQIYTNQTAPYFRSPHIYISVAARFMPKRQVLTEAQAKQLNVNPKYFKDCSDAIFMTTRGGSDYDRTFMEGFIRPGIGLQNWVSRSNYPALNVVQTSPTEMSIYVNQNYAQPTAHLRRYSLRLDGFSSLHASYYGGEMITKPFFFTGNNLIINFSTSAAGIIKVEIQDIDGKVINGFEMENCNEIIGNEIEKIVTWKGITNLSDLVGKPIKLRFIMKDADLFSIKFK